MEEVVSEELAPLEDRADAVRVRIAKEPRYNRVLYRMLDDCRVVIPYSQLEEKILAYPEMAAGMFEPATMVAWLCDCGALQMLPEDDQESSDGAAADSVTEDEAAVAGADSVAQPLTEEYEIYLELTDAGAVVLDEYQNEDRLQQLLDQYPARREAFDLVLELCKTPQTKEDIQARLMEAGLYNPQEALVNFYLDKLEQAGALVWSDGWQVVSAN